jgi:hypothetical protein
MLTAHQGHNAEIEITSDTTAKGKWALYDAIRDVQAKTTFRGYGFYEEEYVKKDDGWRIKSIGFYRTFWEVSKRES